MPRTDMPTFMRQSSRMRKTSPARGQPCRFAAMRAAVLAAMPAAMLASGGALAQASSPTEHTAWPPLAQASSPTEHTAWPPLESWLHDEPWHIVDLHIFTYPNAGDAGGEHWPRHITEAFPQRLIRVTRLSAETKLDALTHPGMLADNVPVAKLAYTALPLSEGMHQDDFGENPLVASHAESLGIARRIARSSRYELVTRMTWLQPTLEPERSPHVLIKAGKQYDRFSELEGTVQLSRRRHLHFDSKLWLSRFEALSTQLPALQPFADGHRRRGPSPEDWLMRPLPKPPEPMTRLAALMPPAALTPPVAAPSTVTAGPHGGALSTPSSSSHSAGATAPVSVAQDRSAGRSAGDGEGGGALALADIDAGAEQPADDTDPAWRQRHLLLRHQVSRAAPLRQNIRLRVGQRQYIDHPLFGMFIKVTPYVPPRASTETLQDGGPR